jgi:hypothetical protein
MTAQEPGVLSYETPNMRVDWLPTPAWLRRTAIAVSLFLLTLFLLGLPPLSGAVDYTRNIPLSEVIQYAWAKRIRGTFNSPSMIRVAMFAPTAIAGLVAFLYLRGVWPRRIAIAINLVLPALWLAHFWPLLIVAGVPILFAALAGRCDGETWSEGFICYAAMASWTTLWLAVALVLILLKWRKSSTKAIRPAA